MLSLQITITGDKRLDTKLKRLGSALFENRESMHDIGKQAATYYANQGFNSQGGVFGTKWQRLSPKYALIKAKLYPGRPPLVATGTMQNNFTFAAGSNQVVIENKSPQFKYHQSTAPRSKMPRRASMGVNAPIKKIVRDIITRDVQNKIRNA